MIRPRPVPVEACPRCFERALVAGECRGCGHLEPEVLERCDGTLPIGAARLGTVAWARRPWIAGRGLLGAILTGPAAAGGLALLAFLHRRLPPAAAVVVALTAVALFWIFACMLVNSTIIEVRNGRLAVRHGPLPVPGLRALSFSVADVERLALRRDLGAGELSESFALEVHARGKVRTVHVSPDREEMARLLRFLREALAPPRRRVH